MDLPLKISTLKTEIDLLQREKNALTNKINAKKDRLKTLELLTVNQIDMFDEKENT